jgi:Clp amino terminal domain, pathogenicity island component
MPPLDVTLESLINSLDSELEEADVLTKVSEARQRARGLAELGDQLVDHYVAAARATGASWSQIGDAMGVSKQAAQQRKGQGTFERFTDRARKVVVYAQDQARTWRHGMIDTEHVLLGVVHEKEGLGAKVLAALAGSTEAVTAVLTADMVRGDEKRSGHIPFTPLAKRVLDETMAAAVELGHNYVGTEHILLGLLRVPEGKAARALDSLGIDQSRAKDAVTAALIGYQHKNKRS